MTVELTDLIAAVNELESIGRKVFDEFLPLWDQDEAVYRHALAVLRAYLEEVSQSEAASWKPDDWGAGTGEERT